MATDSCSACGEARASGARFCPCCGAALASSDRWSPPRTATSEPSADHDATSPEPAPAIRAPTVRRSLPVAGAAVALLLAVGTAVVVADPWDERPEHDGDGEVVLPDRVMSGGTSPGEAGAAAPDADGSDASADALGVPAGCEPSGCDRWRSAQPDGHTIVADGRVFHLGGGALVAIDEAGELVAEAETAVSGRSPGGLLALDEPHDDLLLAVGDGRLEVRDRDDLAVRWSLDVRDASLANISRNDDVLVVIGAHGAPIDDPTGDGSADPGSGADDAGPRLDPPEDGTDDGLRGRRSRPVASGFDVRTGERRWQRSGLPFSTDGVVALASTQGNELRLLDPRDGEDLLHLAGRRYLGSSPDRIAVHDGAETVDLLAWPSLDTVRRLAVDPAATQRLLGGLLVVEHPADEDGTSGDIEVVDPADGRVLDRFERPDVAVRAAPDGDGVIVLEPMGEQVRLRHLDREWQQRWSSEVRFDAPPDARVTAVRGPRGQIGVGVVLDGGRIDIGVLVDDRTGLPVIDDEAGVGTVAGTFDGLLVHRSPDATELRGPGGGVRFPGPVDLLHPSDPLLVRDGQDLVAIDERQLRGP